MLGGAGGGGGAIGQFPFEQWFYEMPACTRYWTTATIITSVLVQCHVITPFQLFYSFRAVFVKNQVRFLVKYARDRKLTQFKVLATNNNLPLLRPPLARPPLPRLFPPALLPPPRGVIRSLSRSILMAAPLRYHPSASSLSYA